eukprot:UN15344
MIYTSGYFITGKENIKTAQIQKMEQVCEKLQMKKGDKYLDIGCGWGTLIAHAAKKYKVESTGVTVAKKGAEFARQRIKEYGVDKSARVLNIDYRDR